ncbi:MAG: methyltransferase domain-containing protein [Marivibrio sp.]|uniref:class I SAM-dependent methyltransferase n=1 Tax=Marivibrio sp. TaxID=2039719 RepID=UPI0032EE288A
MTDDEAVRAHWREKAPAWSGWADTMAAMADRFNQPLLDAVGAGAGDRVLDLAAGAGEPALSAAARVGETGCVIATDLVPEMLAGLAKREGAARLHLAAADMQRLPIAEACIDRVTCRFGIMFVPDAALALAEVRRVLRPGGTCGFLVWGPRADQTLFTVLGDAVAAIAGLPDDDPHFQIFTYGEAGSLARAMETAGLSEVQERPLAFTPTAPADRPFWRPQLAMSFGHRVDMEDKALLRRLDEAIRERLAPLKTEDGSAYRMRVHLRLATGARPA